MIPADAREEAGGHPPAPVRPVAVEALAVLAASFVAAIAVTWPLVTKLGHSAHDPFDPRFQAWTIDWVQHALRHPGSLFDANIFHPEPNTLAYSDSLLGVAIPLLPLRWLGASPIAQLNVAILVGLATSAAAGYLFGRVTTGSRVAAAVTGAAFAFGPFGTLSTGALHATARAGIAIAATAAWWLAERARRGDRLGAPAVLLAGAVVWQASVSFYPGAYAATAALVVLAVRFRALGRRGVAAAVAALAATAAAVLVLALPYLSVRSEFPSFGRRLRDIGPLGADFLHTDPRLSVWGSLLGKGSGWPVYGEPAFPGLVLLGLAVVGVVAIWRRGPGARTLLWVGGGLVAAGAVLGVGASATGWRRFAPYRLIFEHVPGWEALRATGRAWAIGLLGLGLLGGVGASVLAGALAARSGRRAGGGAGGPERATPGHSARAAAGAVAAVAVVAILVEGYAPWTGRPEVRVPAADRALAARSEPGAVLSLPALEPAEPARALSGFRQAENVYASTAHHRDTPNGYSGFFPPSWTRTSRAVEDLPAPRALDTLRRLGVRFVIVRSWAAGGAWGDLLDPARARPLRLLGRYDGDLLYEVPPR